jgi:hypothetical protein
MRSFITPASRVRRPKLLPALLPRDVFWPPLSVPGGHTRGLATWTTPSTDVSLLKAGVALIILWVIGQPARESSGGLPGPAWDGGAPAGLSPRVALWRRPDVAHIRAPPVGDHGALSDAKRDRV